MKIAGRDAGQLCVVVDVLDHKYVLIDGDVRRRKCNFEHLEFLGQEVKIKKGADTEEVRKALTSLGLKLKETKKGKKKEQKAKPKRLRKVSEKSVKVVKEEKKSVKKK